MFDWDNFFFWLLPVRRRLSFRLWAEGLRLQSPTWCICVSLDCALMHQVALSTALRLVLPGNDRHHRLDRAGGSASVWIGEYGLSRWPTRTQLRGLFAAEGLWWLFGPVVVVG
jgi:hypothetical protein